MAVGILIGIIVFLWLLTIAMVKVSGDHSRMEEKRDAILQGRIHEWNVQGDLCGESSQGKGEDPGQIQRSGGQRRDPGSANNGKGGQRG